MIDRIPRPASHLSPSYHGGVTSRWFSRPFSGILYKIFFVVVILMINSFGKCLGSNCCLPENSFNGIGCTEEGTAFGGQMYMCVPVNTNDCKYCNNKPGSIDYYSNYHPPHNLICSHTPTSRTYHTELSASECSSCCVQAKLRYFCSGRYDAVKKKAVFGAEAAAAHAAEIRAEYNGTDSHEAIGGILSV